MKAKFPLSLRQRLSASPALRSLRKRQSIQTDPLQTDFSVDLTCFAARHAPYCGGLLCVGASCCCASCATQSNPLFLELSTNQFFFFVLAAGERGWRMGDVRADALGSVLQVHVGRFWGLLGWDTFLVSDLGWETGFGLLSPS